ncbi:MAG: hypothetical protein NT053_00220, partial [Cyanobacteria bacterium]|nr:hypothetical protein [Cyanobacteriota bacterium]
MAAPAEQQLSLVAELVGSGLQGSLFAEAAPAAREPASEAPGGRSRSAAPGSLAAAEASGEQAEAFDADHLLEADAASRPRRRRDAAPRAGGPEEGVEGGGGAAAAAAAGPAAVASATRTPTAGTAVAEAQPGSSASPAAEPGESEHPSDEGHPQPEADLPRWHHHGLVNPAALSPVLRHYVELKAAHPERVLLYRLGDFYEFFFEDALLLSRLLELTLTGKEGGKGIGRVPMAGIPHHAAERYCAELVRRGLSVALCDQLETTPAKGALLRRDITRVLTPGTVLEEGMLAARRNNWLCAVVLGGAGRWGLAVADVSTGEFRVTEREGSGALHQELLQLEAAEVVWPGLETGVVGSAAAIALGGEGGQPDAAAPAPAWCPDPQRLTALPRTPFEAPQARARLLGHFRLASLDGLGLGELPLALRAAGGLLAYLDTTQPGPSAAGAGSAGLGLELPPQRSDTPEQTTVAANNAVADGGSGPGPIPLEMPTVWHAGDQLVL